MLISGLSQGKVIAKISYDTGPASTVASATGKLLVPGTESDDLSSSTTLNSNKEAASSNLQVITEYAYLRPSAGTAISVCCGHKINLC